MKILYLVVLENTMNNDIHVNQVLSLANRGIDYSFLFLSPLFLLDRKGFRINKNKFVQERVKEIKMPLLSQHFTLHLIFFPLFYLVALPCFLVQLFKVKPSIIHCRNLLSTLLAISAKTVFRFKYKVVSDPRSVYVEESVIQKKMRYRGGDFRVWKYIEKSLYEKSDACFGLSPYFSDIYLKQFNKKSFFIPAVVDDKKVYEPTIRENMRINYSLGSNDIVLCYLGSIGLWHSIECLISMIKHVKESLGNRFRIRIVLLMNNTRAINTVYKEFGQESVLFAGRVPPEDVFKYLLLSDYGIVPGTSDNDPCHDLLNKTMLSSKAEEYLVAGLPILVNPAISSLAKIVRENHAGEIVNQDSLFTLNDYDRQLISDSFSKLFSVTSVVKQYQQVYHSIL